MRAFVAAASHHRRYGLCDSATGGHGGTSVWLVAWGRPSVASPILSGGILGTLLYHHICIPKQRRIPITAN